MSDDTLAHYVVQDRPQAEPMSNRDAAWAKVRDLLEALPYDQRGELWPAVCDYGHACATDAIKNLSERLRRP